MKRETLYQHKEVALVCEEGNFLNKGHKQSISTIE
jgi:hypothetical protein